MATKSMPSQAELESDEETPEVKAPRARLIKPPTKGAQVTQTVRFTTDEIEENEIETNENGTATHSGAFANQSNFSPREYQTPPIGNTPTDRLAKMFEEMADYQEYDNQVFYAFIARRMDFANDQFRRQCPTPQAFAPLQVSTQSALSFIATLQRINGDSGGRFDIRITNDETQDTGIVLNNFVVSDPIIAASPASAPSEMTTLLEIMREERKHTDERFTQILEAISKPPPPDEFMQIAREKLRNDILHPPQQQSGFKPEDMVEKLFTTELMLRTMSEKMANAFGGGEKAEQTTLDKILNNELLMSKASDLVESITAAAENIILTRSGASAQAAPVVNNGYPPLNPAEQAAQQAAQDENTKAMQNTINTIIAELESDNPITLENETLQTLLAGNPQLFDQLKQLCGVLPFEVLLTELEKVVPDTFAEFYTETTDAESGEKVDELNERGVKVEKRLREFYDLLKTPPPPAS